MIMVGGRPLNCFIFSIAGSVRVDIGRLPVHVTDANSIFGIIIIFLAMNLLLSLSVN